MIPKEIYRNFYESLAQYDATNVWGYIFQVIHSNAEQDAEEANLQYEISKSEENMNRNRYINVLPFDEYRVKLNPTGENKDGYVNASHVKMEEAKRNYILCQGPLENTSVDFWQMIWEQNVPVIVMLNKLIEGGKWKCFDYYPDKHRTQVVHGNWKIELDEEVDKGKFYHRILKLTNSETEEERTVHHIQYIEWPDFGVPPSTRCFLEMLNFVKSLKVLSENLEDPPSVVHCSAGIGRSGSFVFVDSVLRLAELGVEMGCTIEEYILKMRRQRSGLIQTPTQLRFAWAAIINGLEATYGFNPTILKDDYSMNEKFEEPSEEAPSTPEPKEETQETVEKIVNKRGSSTGDEEVQEGKDAEEETGEVDSARAKRRELIAQMVEKSRASETSIGSPIHKIRDFGTTHWKMSMSVGAICVAAAAYYFARSA